ncbi:MAG: leucine-rich repeat protein [Clostridia bacterium]|nr:leucine-rich repeat protein [Clostridia bacterium]
MKQKRLLFAIITVLFVGVISATLLTACEDNADYTEGLKFTINEDRASYSVAGIGDATDTDIVIPSVYNGKPVTEIALSAFSERTEITSVVVPYSVTTIGNSAFSYCDSLKSVTISNRVTKIGG